MDEWRYSTSLLRIHRTSKIRVRIADKALYYVQGRIINRIGVTSGSGSSRIGVRYRTDGREVAIGSAVNAARWVAVGVSDTVEERARYILQSSVRNI